MRTPSILAALLLAQPTFAQPDRAEHLSDPYLPPAQPIRLSLPATSSGFLPRGFPSGVQVNTNAAGMNILGDAANEPSIAVDPVDPRRMAIGWRQFDNVASNFRQAGRAYSRDGGRTWIPVPVLQPGVFRSDPVLRADLDGRFYYLSLMSDFSTQMFVSLDGGATFPNNYPAIGGDKEWFTIDLSRASPTYGALYEIYSNAVTRSLDHAQTWAPPVGGNPIWGVPSLSTDSSTLFIAGASSASSNASIVFSRTTNPPTSPTLALSPRTTIPLGGTIRGFLGPTSPNPDGLIGQVWTGVDRSTGPRNGWLYVLGSVGPRTINGVSDPSDIMLVHSTDNGATWSTPVRVNTSTPTANDWQWFGTLGVAPNGRLDVVWFDTRASQASNLSVLYYASSADGGLTWTPNTPLSTQFNSQVGFPNQSKIGDYMDIHSDELGADLAYAATFNGEQDVWYLRIGPRPCTADTNRSGSVTIQDIFDFLSLWFAGDPHADIDRNFTTDIQDIFTYLQLWFTPCP